MTPDPMQRHHDGAGIRLILVGVDGSRGSHRAVEWAAHVAQATRASVLAVHVLTYTAEFYRDGGLDTMRLWRHELEQEVGTRWVEPLRTAGIDHSSVVIEGDSPASGMLDIADREHVDMIVVGAQGHGNLAERVLGGVSYRLAHRAHQPVVIVPPGWSADGE